ncbi:MAG: hypothetical protein PHQ32_06550 [Firmicutes bacterium]|nr:hypothetical protein [Bacillota bacterium]
MKETQNILAKKIDLLTGLAFYKLEYIGTENIPDLAASALEQGYDCPSLRVLSGLRSSLDNFWEINNYLKKALIELGITELSSSTACLILIRYYLQQIIDKEISPLDGLKKVIKNIYYSSEFQSNNLEVINKEYKHNFLGLEVLYSLFYQYDDYLIAYTGNYKKTFKKHESKLINSIIEEAKKYIENYETIKLELIEDEKNLDIVNSIKGLSSANYNQLVKSINDVIINYKITPVICENTKIKGRFWELNKNIVKYVLNRDRKLVLRIVIIKKDDVYLVEDIDIDKNLLNNIIK